MNIRTACVNIATGAVFIAVLAIGAQPASAGTQSGYLMDFQGTVSSLVPNAQLFAGEAFSQQSSGAWRLTFNPTTGLLCLKSNTGWCMASNSGIAKLRPVSEPIHKDMVWLQHVQSGGGFRMKNLDGGYLCALSGRNSTDIVAPTLSQCDSGSDYDTWFWNGTS